MKRKKVIGCFVTIMSLLVIFGNKPICAERDYVAEFEEGFNSDTNLSEQRKFGFEYTDSLSTEELFIMLDQASQRIDQGNQRDQSKYRELMEWVIFPGLVRRWEKFYPYPQLEVRLPIIRDKTKNPYLRGGLVSGFSEVKYSQDVQFTQKDLDDITSMLLGIAKDKKDNARVRSASIRSLTDIVFGAKRRNLVFKNKSGFCDLLLQLIQDKNEAPLVLARAAEHLGEMEDRRVIEPLLQIMANWEDYDQMVIKYASWTLGKFKEERAIPAMSQILAKTSDKDTFIFVAQGLGYIGSSKVVKPLVENKDRFGSEGHDTCKLALKRMKPLLTEIANGKAEGPVELSKEALRFVGSN